MYELVSILRACHMMASSRYHGIVTSMPGLVPSAGITMDERIRNLMRERGHQDLLMTVDDPELETKLLTALEKLHQGEGSDGIARTVGKNLKVMAHMGVYFEEEVKKISRVSYAPRGMEWEDYLPPMKRAATNSRGHTVLTAAQHEDLITFLGEIFSQLREAADIAIPREIRDRPNHRQNGKELLELVSQSANFLASKGLKKGDRAGLLAPNSIRWVAMDLALMAEGLIVVPLYSRQAPAELVAMMKDSTPSLVCCADAALRDGIGRNWPEAPPHFSSMKSSRAW